MNRVTRLIFFCIALLCAFAVSFLAYKKMNQPATPSSQETSRTITQIAVAVHDMGRGDKIVASDLKLLPYLQESLPSGSFTALDQAVGRVVLTPIAASNPILEASLAPKEVTKGGMASIIKPQKRAMAVSVDNVIGVAGFLQPGHLVDVLVAIDPKVDGGGSKITKTALENIPVLAIGTMSQETDDKKAKQVTVVTLEVTLEEGEKLALAVNEGRIQLALRNYTDVTPVLTNGTSVDALINSYATEPTVPPQATVETSFRPAPQPTQRPERLLEVINGDKAHKVKIDR